MNKKLFMKNLAISSADLYLYGEIVDEKWWDSDVDAKDLRDAIEGLGNGSVLNIYVNSPGGSVFVASAMVSMLERAKERGVTVNAYVDGLAASAASFLIMAADNIIMYKNSMLMIHKPMSYAWGNANDLQSTIDALNTIEDVVMLPLYEKKAIGDLEKIKQMINDETWLTADETAEFFNVTISEAESQIAALADKELLNRYKNVPDALSEKLKPAEPKPAPEPKPEPIDYSKFEEVINKLRKER